MITPLLPMRVSGAIWYQGESNVGQDAYYSCAFPAMINDWRNSWGYSSSQFPFFFVQLAPWFPSDVNLPLMRLCQTSALALPGVGMAVAADLGDALSPVNNIHPRNKQEVGRRLALAAFAIAYKEKVNYMGPTATYATVVASSPIAVVEVYFKEESIGSGLMLKQTPVCPPQVDRTLCGVTFEVQSSNFTWEPATPSISSRKTLLLSVVLGSGYVPIAVRSIYWPWPLVTLYNMDNLPSPSFYLSLL